MSGPAEAKRPLFIVFEGMDGSGKTTQIDLLAARLRAAGRSVVTTAEPTDGPIGSLLRQMLRGRVTAEETAIAALFAADRLDHINHPTDGMRALRERGYDVISSRYYFSSLAYQGGLTPRAWVADLNRLAREQYPADLTIFLDLEPEESMRRITAGRASTERYETLDRLTRVRAGFLAAFEDFGQGERIVVVDGSGGVEEVAEVVWGEVERIGV